MMQPYKCWKSTNVQTVQMLSQYKCLDSINVQKVKMCWNGLCTLVCPDDNNGLNSSIYQ